MRACDNLNFLCLYFGWDKLFDNSAPNGDLIYFFIQKFLTSTFYFTEMKTDGGIIDDQRKSFILEKICQKILFLSAASSSSGRKDFKVGPESTTMKCPQCKLIVSSRVVYEASMQTHVVAAMLIP